MAENFPDGIEISRGSRIICLEGCSSWADDWKYSVGAIDDLWGAYPATSVSTSIQDLAHKTARLADEIEDIPLAAGTRNIKSAEIRSFNFRISISRSYMVYDTLV